MKLRVIWIDCHILLTDFLTIVIVVQEASVIVSASNLPNEPFTGFEKEQMETDNETEGIYLIVIFVNWFF